MHRDGSRRQRDASTRVDDGTVAASDNSSGTTADSHPTGLDELGGDPESAPHRLIPLDPRRPAQHLPEDLIDGIRGCQRLYVEDADDTDQISSAADSDEEDDDPDADTREGRAELFAGALTALAVTE